MVKKKEQLKPHVVIFVEGDTDDAFFHALLEYYRKTSKSQLNSCEIVNMKGVSKYNAKFASKLKNDIIPKAADKGKYVKTVCCSYDTDVFEYAEHPVVDWNKIRKTVLKFGISDFIEIKVEHAIEDWLLDDVEGICKFLGIKEIPTSFPGNNGAEKLNRLFRKKNLLYAKGYDVKNLLPYLDFGKIRRKRKSALRELELSLGFKE